MNLKKGTKSTKPKTKAIIKSETNEYNDKMIAAVIKL